MTIVSIGDIPESAMEVIRRYGRRAGLSPEAIVGRGHTLSISRVRKEVAKALRGELGMSYSEIGLVLGNRHPTSIIYLVLDKSRAKQAAKKLATKA